MNYTIRYEDDILVMTCDEKFVYAEAIEFLKNIWER
jgi:hypothetical protein